MGVLIPLSSGQIGESMDREFENEIERESVRRRTLDISDERDEGDLGNTN